jgi:hypothetical protein
MKKRTLPPDSLQFLQCFTDEELLRYRKTGKPGLVGVHLDQCARCRDRYGRIGEAKPESRTKAGSRVKPGKFEPLRIPPGPETIEEGQFWTTLPSPRTSSGRIAENISAAGGGRAVMIIWAGKGTKDLTNLIRVIPISWDFDFLAESEDLFIPEKKSPLGIPFFIETWNERLMYAGNLADFRGLIGKTEKKKLDALRAALRPKRHIPEDIREWRKRERQLTDYLSLPVALSIREAPIELQRYRAAADDEGLKLSEVRPMTLIETDRYSLVLVQVRDTVVLRLLAGGVKSQSLAIDGHSIQMTPAGKGLFECVLGKSDSMPKSVELHLNVLGDELVLQPRFRKK